MVLKFIDNKYCISVKGKKRYIVPLTQNNGKVCRINEIDKTANEEVENYMKLKRSKYTGFDFEFKPFTSTIISSCLLYRVQIALTI